MTANPLPDVRYAGARIGVPPFEVSLVVNGRTHHYDFGYDGDLAHRAALLARSASPRRRVNALNLAKRVHARTVARTDGRSESS